MNQVACFWRLQVQQPKHRCRLVHGHLNASKIVQTNQVRPHHWLVPGNLPKNRVMWSLTLPTWKHGSPPRQLRQVSVEDWAMMLHGLRCKASSLESRLDFVRLDPALHMSPSHLELATMVGQARGNRSLNQAHQKESTCHHCLTSQRWGNRSRSSAVSHDACQIICARACQMGRTVASFPELAAHLRSDLQVGNQS